jgi:hypothetical protein
MGVKRLKIKNELNYKRGRSWAYCGECDHFVSHYDIVEQTPYGAQVTSEPRCKIIGLKPGRQYRIHPANICDRYDNTEHMKRIKGMMR